MGKNGFEYGVLPFPGANGISPSRKHILHVIISTFWIIGMILTAQNIHKNYSRYLDYPKIVQTKEEHGVSKSNNISWQVKAFRPLAGDKIQTLFR